MSESPWQCTLSHACHAKEAETKGRQRNPGAYIRPLGSAHCPTPATQKRRRPRDASGTPGRTSDPLAAHIVPRLPRKRGGDQGTPAEPRGVHLTPWQCTLSHACHAKEAETKGRQRNPGAYIRPLGSAHCPTPATQKRRRPRDASGTPGRTSDPLAVHIVPRLPRKRGGDKGTPAEPRGVHPTPWQCTLSHACHAKEVETKGRQRTPGRTSDPLAMHIMSHACHAKEAETKGRQRNPGAYIRPLGSTHCPTPATQKRRRPRDASGTPGRTSDPLAMHIVPRLPRKRGGDQGTPAEPRGVHPTPWQYTLSHACHAKEAETKGRQRNPGAYIRPLGNAHCPTPATQKRRRPRDASGTGRTSDPLAVHIVPRLPRKRGGDQGTPAEPRGVHPTPWQYTLSHACHAKETETKGRQRNPGAYIRPFGNAHCPTPATQKRRRPRDASGTPGRTSDPLAVHIVPRLPRKRGGDQGTPAEPRGVHPTPWQCTLSHACHAKEAETKGRQRNPGAYIRLLGSAHCPTPATQKRRRPRDASGTPGRTSDPLAMHIVPRLPRKRG